MEAYLDNAATTCVYEPVIEKMNKIMSADYGNPSSMHRKGVEAEVYIKEAREQLTHILKCEQKEIIFTSGGTESNNMALIGGALANRRAGKHIITTRFEHASVYNPLIFLEDFDYRITYLDVDEFGHISLEQLKDAICDDTIMVSTMFVNNEIGAVQNIAAISEAIKAKKPGVLYHVDAIQAFGKYKINPKKLGIDMLSVSGHKIHAPKGTGFLYVQDKVKIKPIIYGGGQQKGMRSGTENVPGIAGLATAAEIVYSNLDANVNHMYELKKHLLDRLGEIDKISINGMDTENYTESAPHIVSIGVPGIRSEVLLHTLEDDGIYVSSGAACASNHPAISGSLKAVGVDSNLLESTLRISFSELTTMDEIDYFIDKMKQCVPMLRRYRRH